MCPLVHVHDNRKLFTLLIHFVQCQIFTETVHINFIEIFIWTWLINNLNTKLPALDRHLYSIRYQRPSDSLLEYEHYNRANRGQDFYETHTLSCLVSRWYDLYTYSHRVYNKHSTSSSHLVTISKQNIIHVHETFVFRGKCVLVINFST